MPLQDFTNAYIDCLLWATHNGEYEFLDYNYDERDIEKDSQASIDKDCKKFYDENHDKFDYTEYRKRNKFMPENDDELAGHDFFLTRQGHGTGFWDRTGLLFKDELTESVRKDFKEYNDIFAQDGKVFIE